MSEIHFFIIFDQGPSDIELFNENTMIFLDNESKLKIP